MTQSEIEDITNDIFACCSSVLLDKGADYSDKDDRFRNFREAGARLGITQEQCLHVYLDKHLEAIATYCRNGKVESEPIKGRIIDAINYLIILAGMVEEKT